MASRRFQRGGSRPSLGDRPILSAQSRRFGRLRTPAPMATLRPAEPLGTDHELLPPAGPVIPVKTFVGPNATYYDDCWRWMDWRGRTWSWNTVAAITFGGWLGYRRMYRLAGLHALALSGLGVALVAGAPPTLIGFAVLALALGLGFYGNSLYSRHFGHVHRAMSRRHREPADLARAVARAGGTDVGAGWVTVVVPVLALAIAAVLL